MLRRKKVLTNLKKSKILYIEKSTKEKLGGFL